MATRSFRWRADGGSWNYETEALPFNIASVTDADLVEVEPIGAAVSAAAIPSAVLAEYLVTTDGADNPHSVPVMSSPPTISTQGGGTASAPPAPYTGLTDLYTFVAGNDGDALLVEGGAPKEYATNFRGFVVATIAETGGNLSDGEWGVYYRCTTVTDAQQVAFQVLGGATSGWRFIVDGEYASLSETTVASGGRQWIVLDFGSSASREITIEGDQVARIAGVSVDPSDTIAAAAQRPSGIVFGDSFTSATGATLFGDGYVAVAADYLGVELWASGSGGTGYVADSDGVSLSLVDRLDDDLTRYTDYKGTDPDFVIFAMGVNDRGESGVTAAANTCFDAVRLACPDTVVFVVGPWDQEAPSDPLSPYDDVKAEIQAAVGSRDGFYFLDPEGVTYTKSDDIHPDTSGHDTLGQWLDDAIRTALGIGA